MKARDNNDIEPKLYYKHYCNIYIYIYKVIKEVIKLYYKEVITKSKNKMTTTWKIIRNENNIKLLRINNHILHNPRSIANELNDYFLNIAGSISYKRINKKRRCKSITTVI